MRFRPSEWGVVALALALASCQPAPVPVQQAKTASLDLGAGASQTKFVAPPRTISDLTPLLDKIAPPTELNAARRKTSDAAPPAGLSGNALADFLYRRAEARYALGQGAAALADAKEAVALARDNHAEPGLMNRYLDTLASIEANRGEPRAALETRLGILAPPGDLNAWYWKELAPAWQLVALGDLAEARRRLEETKPVLERSRNWNNADLYYPDRLRAWQEINGQVERNSGHYAAAEKSFRRALAAASETVELYPRWTKGPATAGLATYLRVREGLRDELAWVLALEGKLAEAEAVGRQALVNQLDTVGRASTITAGAAMTLASIVLEENRPTDAERLAKAALDIDRKAGLPDTAWPVLEARTRVATYENLRGHSKTALELFDRIAADLAGNRADYDRFLGGNTSFAFAALAAGRNEQALAIIDRALAKSLNAFGEKSRYTAQVRGWRAVALERLGRTEEALAAFRTALPILAADQSVTGDRGRIRRQVVAGYLRLLSEIRGTPLEAQVGDASAEAFFYAELVHGQTVQEAVERATARTQLHDPALADLARREQDAAQQIGALDGLLVNLAAETDSQRDPAALARLQETVDRLERERAGLRAEIERRFPAYAALVRPKPPTIDLIRAALRPGETFIATYTLDDRALIWAIPQAAAPVFAVVPVERKEIERLVARLRAALDPHASSLGDIPAFDVAAANRLYAALLEPVKAGWRGSRSLVVDSGWFGELPPSVLVTQQVAQPADTEGQPLFAGYKTVPFLAREMAVSQVPSAAAFYALRALPPGDPARRAFAGFGDPWFNREQAAKAEREAAQVQLASLEARGFHLRASPQTESMEKAELSALPPLPDTAEEVREVAASLKADPQRDVFLGAAASVRRVETMKLDDRRVVMFATHGLVPGDLDGLSQPALALSSPSVTGEPGDGLLTMDEILGLKLDADWVVLSACNTAAGSGKGAEAASGLGRAFFYAGARALLLTNWPVETRSARLLTTGIFRHQAAEPGLSRAEALRRAELDLIDGPGSVDASGRTAYSYAHPIFWAPYSLVGDGG